MKREIKFRAWDKKYNLMERGVFGIRSDGLVSSNSGADNVVLMQFTGLKDKNGKEIYESDIVSTNGCYCGCIPSGNEVVEWKEFGMKEGEGAGYLFWEKDNLVVIGNIYENPELLVVR